MIKKVSIKNFESHEDSEIEFTNGLNLVVGPSNNGKSSIVRAIAMVCANRFDKDCVRNGAKSCLVKIETERGTVEAERGEGINVWKICSRGEEKEYRNIGTGVPPEAVEILGMGERRHGEVSEIPNILFQLDKHYMLAEIDGRKTTSNMIARMMDDAIGIGGMEDIVRNLATTLLDEKKDITRLEKEVSSLEAKRIPDGEYAAIEDSVHRMESIRGEVNTLVENLGRLEQIAGELAAVENEIEVLSSMILSEEGAIREFLAVNEIRERLLLLSEFKNVNIRTWDASAIVNAIENAEVLLGSLCGIYEELKILGAVEELSRRISDIPVSIVDLEEVEKTLGECTRKSSELFALEKFRDDWDSALEALESLEKASLKNNAALAEIENDLDILEKKLGKCPLCGGTLKREDR